MASLLKKLAVNAITATVISNASMVQKDILKEAIHLVKK